MSKYTNSPLIKYTRLSPNHSGQRNHEIDTITIHCVVGHVTLESLGSIFANPARQASSNYGVDDNGNVGMFVEEKNRSWCSSSASNDNRAITIEVCSDKTAPYAITEKAMGGVIALCADICKRNGIKKLLWRADKNLLGNIEKQNISVHQWLASTECPGDYIYQRLGQIAKNVNTLLGVSNPDPTVPLGPVIEPEKPIPPVDYDNSVARVIWDRIKSKGFSDFATAGLLGNLYAESALNPKNLQNSFEKKLGMTDESYTQGVDNGTYKNFVKDSAGYGLAQWTFYTRKQKLLDFAKARKVSIGNMEMQIDFMNEEIRKQYIKLLGILQSTSSVADASDAVLLEYERPADQSEKVKQQRREYSQKYFKMYSGMNIGPVPTPTPEPEPSPLPDPITPTNFPYVVQIINSPIVNYRSGPGTNYKVNGQVRLNEVYTIVEEASGVGASKWGRLKSGAGWISLDFCKRR